MREKLNSKQIDIIRLSTLGYTNEAMADKLCVSINTIKYHKKEIFRKYKVNSIPEAIRVAYSSGIFNTTHKSSRN